MVYVVILIVIVLILLWATEILSKNSAQNDQKIETLIENTFTKNNPLALSMDDKIVGKNKKLVAPLARTTGMPLARRVFTEELNEKDILTWWD